MKIHVIHENEAWTAPLFAALEARNLPFEDWHLDTGRVDPRTIPPEGVFWPWPASADSWPKGAIASD